MSEEKKLTDEEIVKALECCSKTGVCYECPYYINRIDCVPNQRSEKDTLDLIHRLQDENKRLTEENGYLDGCAKQFLADYQKCEIERAELQEQVDELEAENEELAEANFKLKTLYDYSNGYKAGRRDGTCDTAKEILQELWDETEPMNESHKWVRLRIKNIAMRKGIEVE